MGWSRSRIPHTGGNGCTLLVAAVTVGALCMTTPVPLTRPQVLRGNRRWFEGVSLVVISNTLWVGERVPCLTYGMRGMISLSIEVRFCIMSSTPSVCSVSR
jgi:hypothetical protein